MLGYTAAEVVNKITQADISDPSARTAVDSPPWYPSHAMQSK